MLGIKGDVSFLANKADQSKSLNHTWDFTSFGPFNPNLEVGFLSIHLLIKSEASWFQDSGVSAFLSSA